jgi:hypothetical protein
MARMSIVEWACILAIAVAMVELPNRDLSACEARAVLDQVLALAQADASRVFATTQAEGKSP